MVCKECMHDGLTQEDIKKVEKAKKNMIKSFENLTKSTNKT